MSFPPLRQGDVIAKKYEIETILGQGPAGQACTARTLSTGKKVVVKALNGQLAELAPVQSVFDRVRSAQSDALATLLDVGLHGNRPFVVQEYFEGESLRRLLDEYAGARKSFTLQEAAQIVVKVLEAADAAHAAGLVHRHIKPTNVLIHSRAVGPGQGKTVRTIKVTGLGLADMLPAAGLQEALMERGDNRYMAPELTSPNAGGGPQADVYSAGVLFYELLTGQTPQGTYLSPSQIREELPSAVDDIVDLALASNADDRFPTARDMINAIQRSFHDDAPTQTGVSRRIIGAVAGATLLLVLMVFAALATSDPLAEAKRSDETVRAQIVKSNPLPDEATMRARLEGHPDMAFIPAGSYVRGRLNVESSKVANATEPLVAIGKTKAYYIDRLEWDNQKGSNPTVSVSLSKAEALCAERGKRLCTADEWERACKGPESRIYTYGDTFNPAKCGAEPANDSDRDGKADRAAGSEEDCKSGWGVYDMSGGVREWTASADPAQKRFNLVKGGKTGDAERGSRCAFAESRNPENGDGSIGFRCCQDADPPPAPEGAPAEGAAPVDGAAAPGAAAPAAAPAAPAAAPAAP